MNKNKKKVTLITTNQIDLGIRAIAGCIKKDFDFILINLSTDENTYEKKYPETIINQVKKLVSDSDFLLFSVTDLFFERTVHLSNILKKEFNIPIIYGGIHATLYPQECIPYCDAVATGESDRTINNLLKKWDTRFKDIKIGFWLKKGKKIIKLPRDSLIHNLDSLPKPYFSYKNYFALINKDTVADLSKSKNRLKIIHHQIGHKNTVVYASDRGCPNSCTYCYNRNLRELYLCKPYEYFRKKSIIRIIEELKQIKKESPWAEFLNLMNDDSAARTEKELELFAKLYKKEIGLPFYCMVSPQSLNENKLKYLIEAGCVELNMGIQTNEKVNKEIYERHQSDKLVLERVNFINKYTDKIKAFYDFIINNPAETEENILDTISLVKKIPIPFDLVSHHLVLGDGTVLFKRLLKQGVITNDHNKIYGSNYHDFDKYMNQYVKRKNFFMNIVMEWVAGNHNKKFIGRLPRKTKKFLKFKPFVEVLNKSKKLQNFIKNAEIKNETLDFLIANREFFKKNTNIVVQFHKNLPETKYSNQQDNIDEC